MTSANFFRSIERINTNRVSTIMAIVNKSVIAMIEEEESKSGEAPSGI